MLRNSKRFIDMKEKVRLGLHLCSAAAKLPKHFNKRPDIRMCLALPLCSLYLNGFYELIFSSEKIVEKAVFTRFFNSFSSKPSFGGWPFVAE